MIIENISLGICFYLFCVQCLKIYGIWQWRKLFNDLNYGNGTTEFYSQWWNLWNLLIKAPAHFPKCYDVHCVNENMNHSNCNNNNGNDDNENSSSTINNNSEPVVWAFLLKWCWEVHCWGRQEFLLEDALGFPWQLVVVWCKWRNQLQCHQLLCEFSVIYYIYNILYITFQLINSIIYSMTLILVLSWWWTVNSWLGWWVSWNVLPCIFQESFLLWHDDGGMKVEILDQINELSLKMRVETIWM